MTIDLLKAKNLIKRFPVTKGFFESILRKGSAKYVSAIEDVSFSVKRNEIFSLVGETGSGKTTLANLILKLTPPTSGEVFFEGENIYDMDKKNEANFRRNVQMIFQDPFASLNPRKKVLDIVSSPLRSNKEYNKVEIKDQVFHVLNQVGLTPPEDVIEKYPHEFSGGQRQRIGVARALVVQPKLIVADEPVSSLDMSIQAQILNLLVKLQRQFDLTYLFLMI